MASTEPCKEQEGTCEALTKKGIDKKNQVLGTSWNIEFINWQVRYSVDPWSRSEPCRVYNPVATLDVPIDDSTVFLEVSRFHTGFSTSSV